MGRERECIIAMLFVLPCLSRQAAFFFDMVKIQLVLKNILVDNMLWNLDTERFEGLQICTRHM